MCILHFSISICVTSLPYWGLFLCFTLRSNCSLVFTGWKEHWSSDKMNIFCMWCPDLFLISFYPSYSCFPPSSLWSLDSPIRNHAWKDCIRLHCFNSLRSPHVSWCWSAYLSICEKAGNEEKNANSARQNWVCPYLNIIRLAVARGPSLFCCWQPRCCVFS